ncbi:hypothetical protein SKAU_G00331310 [Synaphobranchus kaupii]|uniref:Uncharacterized protein n=1 Tax=Synaphobranchus kaupii TaxID=118154 RepID=A0A9Q1ELD1_SYNKA|nr:hypothetical protein SKAU_G00331310 [Synaphobranchus kaupii]
MQSRLAGAIPESPSAEFPRVLPHFLSTIHSCASHTSCAHSPAAGQSEEEASWTSYWSVLTPGSLRASQSTDNLLGPDLPIRALKKSPTANQNSDHLQRPDLQAKTRMNSRGLTCQSEPSLPQLDLPITAQINSRGPITARIISRSLTFHTEARINSRDEPGFRFLQIFSPDPTTSCGIPDLNTTLCNFTETFKSPRP